MSDHFTKEPMYWSGENCVQPEAIAETGYVAGDNPAAEHENYFRHQTYLCIKELQVGVGYLTEAVATHTDTLSNMGSRISVLESSNETLQAKNEALETKLNSYLFNTATPVSFLSDDKGLYYLDENGEKLTGEQEINGIPYVFYDNGYLRTNWVTTASGKRYYYSPDDGNIVLGWVTHQENKYYVTLMEGKLVNQYRTIDGVYYHFDADGVATEA